MFYLWLSKLPNETILEVAMSLSYEPKLVKKSRNHNYPNSLVIDQVHFNITKNNSTEKITSFETDAIIQHHDIIHALVTNIVQKIRSSGIEFPEYEPFSPLDEIIVAIFDSLTDNKKRVYFNENGFVNEYLFISQGEIDGSKTNSNVTSIPFWESILISETEKLQLRKDFIGDIIMRSV
jgi:hypothetical protein